MKIKTLLLTISTFVMMLSMNSCKKDSADTESGNGSIKVKYELTSTLPFSADPNYANFRNVVYTNATYNPEIISDLSGKNWVKEITIQDPQKNRPLSFGGLFMLEGLSGTVNAKIYINGVVKSEVNQVVQKATDELSTATINVVYFLK